RPRLPDPAGRGRVLRAGGAAARGDRAARGESAAPLRPRAGRRRRLQRRRLHPQPGAGAARLAVPGGALHARRGHGPGGDLAPQVGGAGPFGTIAAAMRTFLEERRDQVANALGLSDEILLVGAGDYLPIPGGADQTYPFRAHNEYFYLA